MEVVLDQNGVALGVDHLVGVDAEAFHVPVAGRNAARAEQMRQHVHGFGRLAHEVEDAVRLLAERDRIGLQGVDDIRELDGVADEEDREVVADEIPVAVLGIELHREAARIAGDLGGVAAADHGREADGQRRLLAGFLEQLGAGVFGGGLVADLAGRLELAVADEAAGMDDALGDPLAVEMGDLLQELIVLQRGRTAAADGALGLVVGDRMALPVGQDLVRRSRRCFGALIHGFLP